MNTKKLSFKWLMVAIVLVLCADVSVFGRNKDTLIVKSVNLGQNDIVVIENPLCEIDIKTWDKNELKIEYSMSVNDKSDEIRDGFIETFSGVIDKQFKKANSGKVLSNVVFKHFINKSEVNIRGDNHNYVLKKFEVHYLTITMPKTNALQVSTGNKITIADLESDANIKAREFLSMGNCKNLVMVCKHADEIKIGKVENAKIELRACNIELESVKNDVDLSAYFSNVIIGNIGNNATLELRSSSFETKNINELDLEGKFIRKFSVDTIYTAKMELRSCEINAHKIGTLYSNEIYFSTFKIKEVGSMDIKTSRSTKFFIDSISSITAKECSFSSFYIAHLTKMFFVDSRSGEIKIDNVENGFEKIEVNGIFVTVKLNIESDSEYKLIAELERPEYKFNNITLKNIEKEPRSESILGFKGTNENPGSTIKLNCKNCELEIN